jgi:hypothetical protein
VLQWFRMIGRASFNNLCRCQPSIINTIEVNTATDTMHSQKYMSTNKSVYGLRSLHSTIVESYTLLASSPSRQSHKSESQSRQQRPAFSSLSSLLGILSARTSCLSGFSLDEQVDQEKAGKQGSQSNRQVSTELDLQGNSVARQ